MSALDRLIDACEDAVAAQCHVPESESIPEVLVHPLWLLSEAVEQVRPGWTERLIQKATGEAG